MQRSIEVFPALDIWDSERALTDSQIVSMTVQQLQQTVRAGQIEKLTHQRHRRALVSRLDSLLSQVTLLRAELESERLEHARTRLQITNGE